MKLLNCSPCKEFQMERVYFLMLWSGHLTREYKHLPFPHFHSMMFHTALGLALLAAVRIKPMGQVLRECLSFGPLYCRYDPSDFEYECLSKPTHYTQVIPANLRRRSSLDAKLTIFYILLLLKGFEAVLNKLCVPWMGMRGRWHLTHINLSRDFMEKELYFLDTETNTRGQKYANLI